ncbi:MAG TPA: S8 family serine peptidase [Chloroflexota bacterium]|nr:S8 family serine peptidase [Chloroflexota bacterium]
MSTRTGAGVRIALIDSGVNPAHSHVGPLAGGVAFSAGPKGEVLRSSDFQDTLGHGTALAGILKFKAPEAELFAVKIFTDRLVTSIEILEAALRWAIEQKMHVVNLSLGTDNPEHRARMARIAAMAKRAGTLIAASSPSERADMLPAALDGVFGVAASDDCSWSEYRYVADDPIHFRAHPSPRPLPGLDQSRNYRGHSFASAHLSALLALLVQDRPELGFVGARERLVKSAGVPLPLKTP